MQKPTLPIAAVILATLLASPLQSEAQAQLNGKKLLWAGVALMGGGVGAAVYGAHARKVVVAQYSYSVPSNVIVSAGSGSSSVAAVVVVPVCFAMPCTMASPAVLVGYSEQRKTKWGIVAPAVGAAAAGSVIALLSRKHMRVAATPSRAAISYVW